MTRGRALVALRVVLFAAPALGDLLRDLRRAPYRWLAADTFYYLTVSRNIARLGASIGENVSGFTFEQQFGSADGRLVIVRVTKR